jgi:MYXO-CTERM domain-containing protein
MRTLKTLGTFMFLSVASGSAVLAQEAVPPPEGRTETRDAEPARRDDSSKLGLLGLVGLAGLAGLKRRSEDRARHETFNRRPEPTT